VGFGSYGWRNFAGLELGVDVNGGGEEKEEDEQQSERRESVEGVSRAAMRKKRGCVAQNVQNAPPSFYFLSQADSYTISLV